MEVWRWGEVELTFDLVVVGGARAKHPGEADTLSGAEGFDERCQTVRLQGAPLAVQHAQARPAHAQTRRG